MRVACGTDDGVRARTCASRVTESSTSPSSVNLIALTSRLRVARIRHAASARTHGIVSSTDDCMRTCGLEEGDACHSGKGPQEDAMPPYEEGAREGEVSSSSSVPPPS